MIFNWRNFYQACDPFYQISTGEDRKYYTDFSSVRGAAIIKELQNHVELSLGKPLPRPKLFTGHTGCGKSTELLELKYQLEQKKLQVIYFDVSDVNIDPNNVVITDIFLAVAAKVDEFLQEAQIFRNQDSIKTYLQGVAQFFKEIELEKGSVTLGPGKVNFNTKEGFSVSAGIFALTAITKDRDNLRIKLRRFLEPETFTLAKVINQEILKPAIESLYQRNKRGLVVIIDGFDRSSSEALETLFTKRGNELQKLDCQLIYTVPLGMSRSTKLQTITHQFGEFMILPMVRLKERGGSRCYKGFELLREMVMKRAFPEESPSQRLHMITRIFDHSDTLDYLCEGSGGNIRQLLNLLRECIVLISSSEVILEESGTTEMFISRKMVERQMRSQGQKLSDVIKEDQWEILRKVNHSHEVDGNEEYQHLLDLSYIYRYEDIEGRWYEINPLLKSSEKLYEVK